MISKSHNKLIITLLSITLLSTSLSSMTACSQKEQAEAIELEPKVITVKTDSDYQRAYEEALEEELDEPEEEFIYDDVNKIYSKETANPDEVVMRFVGDVCFFDGFSLMGAFRDRGSDITNCIDANLLTLMKDADIFMLNNEFCYSERGTPIEGKKYAFRSKPSNVTILADMGADIVSLANNHAYDWGPDALSDTVDVLNNAKVPFVGAGKDIYEAMRPVYFKANGKTISFVSATQIERLGNPDTKEATETSPGVLRTLDPEKACRVIQNAKENSDFCVMYVHWGSENTDLVEASQRELAKKYVESGVDLIIGDHSHCLQGIDYIEDVPVFYSLGNYWFNSKTVDTGIAEVVLSTKMKDDADQENNDKQDNNEKQDDNENQNVRSGKETDNSVYIKSVRFIPAIQRSFSTSSVDDSEKERILSYLQGISNYAKIDISTGEIMKSDTDMNIQGGMNTSPTKKTEEVTEAQPGEITGAPENVQ